ncbi:DUF3048 domain-containing protein, partial [Ruminococcaceae bacterium OttesenSCG-928-I18]|nr:DUF3048 domain-containing protein [Ruminococcaceae bacterium OttesenSCG-928-I18]
MQKKALAVLLASVFLCLFAACTQQQRAGNEIPLPGEEETEQAAELMALPLAGALNPLTGNPAIEGAVEGQRPVAVMVANTQQSLPQRGLAGCDVLLETVAEGGITQLMAMYGDFRMVPQVGPVRSAPDQFVQFAIPSNAIFAHIGATNYAKNLLNVLAYQDVDG